MGHAMTDTSVQFLERAGLPRLAYRHTSGRAPGVLFCPGFKSDMEGGKATAVEAHCIARGLAATRFDYSGHGLSGGDFLDGTISAWRDDALAIIDAVATGPLILVGSSMGGWIALLAALARPDRVASLIGIAPAPDFTQWGIMAGLTDAQKAEMAASGHVAVPSDYSDEPYIYTRRLVDDGRDNLLLDGPIAIDAPVRILQGQRDDAVPWRTALNLAERLTSGDVEVTLVKSGDHRLSGEADIARLLGALDSLTTPAP